jgi:hypothetical protein
VKYAIPLGLLLLVGAAAVLHRASPPLAAGLERRAGVAVVPADVPSAQIVTAPVAAIPVEVAPEAKKPTAGEPDRKASAAVLARMTSVLDRELTLTTHQRQTVEQLLKDRDAEIKACHGAIVRSGVLDIAQYEWQVQGMKEGWFRQVDALLDRAQHDRFVALVQQGFLNEGLAFTVQPGMTVLD